MLHARGKTEIHRKFLWRNLRERDLFGAPKSRGENIKMDLKET
jgi:hypothetical protein